MRTAPPPSDSRTSFAVQPISLPRITPQTRPKSPTPDSVKADEVEALVRAERLAQAPEGERNRDDADRDVDPEDPLPGDTGDDCAADDRAERNGDPADAGPGPSARPRRSLGNASLRIVDVSGMTIAPPNPWTARAASSVTMSVDSAAAAEAIVKIASPIANMRLRP